MYEGRPLKGVLIPLAAEEARRHLPELRVYRANKALVTINPGIDHPISLNQTCFAKVPPQ